MKHVFDQNGISYECCDNSFTHLSDVAKAQELADSFDSKKLCRPDGQTLYFVREKKGMTV